MSTPQPRTLAAHLPPAGTKPTADDLLERFLAGVADRGLTLYPAQEEAILELYDGRHVILGTPTGSGKSLVAEALHFKGLAEGKISYYTCPIKALVNEKFFALCEAFGPDNVGMMTGDATVNREAPIICCTAEILASFSLHEEGGSVDYVVMDEFHYYADRDRGVAWQVPLISLLHAQFLLMSATLGPMDAIAGSLEQLTGRPVAHVGGLERPVPLDFEYRESYLHEAIADLTAKGMAPIYLVNFTQRAAAEQAQALTSVNLCSKAEKEAIGAMLAEVKFDSPYGKDIYRYLRAGVGLHHAGVLPKYRRLTERLAQKGLLKVVSGTDTLGMGINIPIRTVVFSQLCKFDGNKTVVLRARDFHQISGRAGRRGYDDRGLVVVLAPEHIVENHRLTARASAGKKVHLQKPPERGYAHWDKTSFERLLASTPEPLESRFRVDHGMLVDLLNTGDLWPRRGYGRLVELIGRCHDHEGAKRRHLKRAAQILRALRHAGLVELVRDEPGVPRLRVQTDLQWDFSLFHTLSLFLVQAVAVLDRASETYALDLLTLVESILENPDVVLYRQLDKLKGERIAELKAAGVPYEERMEALEKVELPKPNAEAIQGMFAAFAEQHPWIGREDVRPKSIARDLVERMQDFNGYVLELGLQRSEGVLLRYLSEVVRVLARTVPESARDEATDDLLLYLRDSVRSIDSSLLDEWERMRAGEAAAGEAGVAAPLPLELAADDPRRLAEEPRALAARLRNELHRLLRALANRDFEGALALISPLEGEPEWTAAELEAELAPYFAEHEYVDLRPAARLPHNTVIRKVEGKFRWEVTQKIVDPEGESDWGIDTIVDLAAPRPPSAPLITLRGIVG